MAKPYQIMERFERGKISRAWTRILQDLCLLAEAALKEHLHSFYRETFGVSRGLLHICQLLRHLINDGEEHLGEA